MRLLDLFCGAGGAAMGYYRAGFDEIVGVDIAKQPRYPFTFVQADALEYVAEHGREFDLIHASPPCQAFTTARVIYGKQHDDLLTPTRRLLQTLPVPWVIENVPGAPMRADIVLCGSMFGEPRLKRHRLFEFWKQPTDLILLPPCSHAKQIISVFGHGGHVYHGVQEWREVMGIDWMLRDELAQAIPPAYTEFIGREFLRQIQC